MRTIFIGCLLVVFVSALCLAQDPAQTPASLTIRDRGSWGIQFGLTGLNVNSFQGALLSYQKNKPNNSAMRFGLEVSGRLFEELKTTDNPYIGNADVRNTTNSASFTITTQLIKYTELYESVMGYIGGGPLAGGSYSHSKSYDNDKSTSYTVSLGVNVVIGAEWFLKKNLSILAEYNPSLTYTYGKQVYEIPYKITNSTEQLSLNSKGVRVGVSFYFK